MLGAHFWKATINDDLSNSAINRRLNDVLVRQRAAKTTTKDGIDSGTVSRRSGPGLKL